MFALAVCCLAAFSLFRKKICLFAVATNHMPRIINTIPLICTVVVHVFRVNDFTSVPNDVVLRASYVEGVLFEVENELPYTKSEESHVVQAN